MIFTIDRLQFINDKFVAFEFYNLDIEKCNESFINDKVKVLRDLVGTKIDVFYYIKYKDDYSYFEVADNEKVVYYNYEEFSRWFSGLNRQVTSDRNSSKPAGSVRDENTDSYVADLLNTYYKPIYGTIDFFVDDNGLKLVKDILGSYNDSTYGFDFDIYSSNNGIVFEFLKRENAYVNNLSAHPARYPWNKKKFVSLWNATKRISDKNKLALINYSDDSTEPVGLIVIQDFDTDMRSKKMSLGEFAYNIGNKNNILELLKVIEIGITEANEYLSSKPKEVRDSQFFATVYDEKYYENNARWNCRNIGKHYK